MIAYLTPDDRRAIHEVALERYGGVVGEHEPGQIDFMAEKPAQELFGEEIYPGLFLKAAIYMHGFATRQFFADGNKSTAYLSASTFLEINGLTLIVSNEELYTITMDVANGKYTEFELSEWIKENATSNSMLEKS